MKKSAGTVFLDKIHIWSVRSLMGLTLFGCATVGLQVYSYYKNVRPQRRDEIQKEKEQVMAIEQQEKEAELLRRQKDAETLVA